MKRVSNRFTLIEMLAVVAIASILIALITPAVQNLMFGSRVDQCVSNFKLGLEQAQSKAIASRRYVALVLPYNHSDVASVDPSIPYKIYCRSGYRMAYVTKDGDNYKFDRWVENQDWKNPNAGVLCVNISSEPNKNYFGTDEWGGVKKKMESVLEAELLKLNDPWDDDLSNLQNITPELAHLTHNDGDGKNCAVIFSPYGGVVNNENPLYFTFAEGKVDGNKYVFDNVDNILVLKLNAITGQVTYFDPYEE